MSHKEALLLQRAREKELVKFKALYDEKHKECIEKRSKIEPILVKLWNLAGQAEQHATIDSHLSSEMGNIVMTVVPAEKYMRFIGTL